MFTQSRLSTFPFVVLTVFAAGPLVAQTAMSAAQIEAVETQVREALDAEQAVFESRDCAVALNFFADRQPLFVVSGRTIPNKAVLQRACGSMTANRAQTLRALRQHVINVLSPDVAYSVSHYETSASTDAARPQVVTKIWTRVDGRWLIAHLHESVAG